MLLLLKAYIKLLQMIGGVDLGSARALSAQKYITVSGLPTFTL
jgi:hypothetical protein